MSRHGWRLTFWLLFVKKKVTEIKIFIIFAVANNLKIKIYANPI